MPAPPVPGYLAYRVVDSNTGAEIIHNLPHKHTSRWSVNALSLGLPGSAGVGHFTIPLAPVRSDMYRANKAIYDQLAYGQKIEGYLGDVVAGAPRFSGVILSIDKQLNGDLSISGMDTLGWLAKTSVVPGQYIPVTGATSSDVVRVFKQGIKCGFDDSCTSLSGYTQTPASRWTLTTDPQTGVSAFNCSTLGSESYIISNTSLSSTLYSGPSYAIGNFYVFGGGDTTNAGEATLVIGSDGTAANCIFARANVYASGGFYNVDAELWTRTNSVNTRQLQKVGVLSGAGGAIRIQIIVSTYYIGSATYIQMFVNGADCGTWQYSNAGTYPSGALGFRFNATNGQSGTPNVWAERLRFAYRDTSGALPLFADGTIGSAAVTWLNNQHLNGQTALDLLALAMTTEGWYIRKNAGAGYRADSIDFSATPGVDRSKGSSAGANVIFEQDDNLVDLATAANADIYATDTRVAATPGLDTGGGVTYPSVQAVGNLILTDTVLNAGATTQAPLMQFAAQVGATKSTPGQAKTAVVLRDPKTVDVWRELDYVTLNAPDMGLNYAKVLILGYTFEEGKPTQQVIFDQYSAAFDRQNYRRLIDSARIVTGRYATR